jgi:hypothetical protein
MMDLGFGLEVGKEGGEEGKNVARGGAGSEIFSSRV